ncbi:hypothetical protein [Xenophilus sp.]|uniref:hypothetical protein n=1 Tax=Xenophilus sp. TaxID=1873499 RepID=UPI0037DD5E19
MTDGAKQDSDDVALMEKLRAYHVDDPLIRTLAQFESKAHATMLEGGKALALLNSAGVAAMLALAQSLIGKQYSLFQACKPFIVFALVMFLSGALLASIVAIPIAQQLMARALAQRSDGLRTGARYLVGAVLAFLAGGMCALLAIAFRL